MSTRIGVIADTHGLLRPEATRALRGVDRIVHAGDIGSPEVLKALIEIDGARVSASRVELSVRRRRERRQRRQRQGRVAERTRRPPAASLSAARLCDPLEGSKGGPT